MIAEVVPCATVDEAGAAGPVDVAIVHARWRQEFGVRCPGVAVVVLSGGPPPPDYVGLWVMKPAPMSDLLPALRAAVAGEMELP